MRCSEKAPTSTHPKYTGDCSDLLAYFEAVAVKRTFRARVESGTPNTLLQGEYLARTYGCFQCHGELGQGGLRNAGALKGYVPGYFGNDFRALTRGGSTDSVKAWITKGVDPALIDRPVTGRIARFFLQHQAISMPKYATLPDAEIRLLTAYVVKLSQFGEMDAQKIRAYAELTQAVPVVQR